jgi:manganese/zinc/iron transport system permease protein
VTKGGAERAQRIVRRHRLWEAYLEHVLGVPSEHVHSEAEWVEHVLTPELERRLEELLDYPAYDPHGRSIPRQRSEE